MTMTNTTDGRIARIGITGALALLLATLCLAMSASTASAAPMHSTPGWYKEGAEWYYYDSSGNMVFAWQKIGGKWYHFDVNGQMTTGLFGIYNGKSGLDDMYYCNADGSMFTGWKKITGGYANGWMYFTGSGKAAVGWYKVGGKWYWFDDGGVMATGFAYVESDESMYYFGSDGAMKTGWQKFARPWDGQMAWYHFEKNGKASRGWVKSGTTWYYCDYDGEMYANRGMWTSNTAYYYLKSSGAMAASEWVKVDHYNTDLNKYEKVWMYFGASGKAYRNGWQKIGGTWYVFDSECIMQTGWYWDTYLYYLGSNGAMRTGWAKIDGNWYYFDKAGRQQSDGWLELGGELYYLDASGVMLCDGNFEIGGAWYTFDRSGRLTF